MNQQAPNKEIVPFKIGLSGTFWDKCPAFSIWINDTKYVSGILETKETCEFKFSAELEDECSYELKIRLENKENSDTVVENETIVKDLLLNIESIEIDGIELGELKWSESEFIPDDRLRRPVLDQCVNLGWNGTYCIKFISPFYLWLLEKA